MKGKHLLYGNGQLVVNGRLKQSVFWQGSDVGSVSSLRRHCTLNLCRLQCELLVLKRAHRNSVCQRFVKEKPSNINPQADVVQSLNEESGLTANSKCKNTRIWALKKKKKFTCVLSQLCFLVVQLFRIYDVHSLGNKGVWKHAGFFITCKQCQVSYGQSPSGTWKMQNVVWRSRGLLAFLISTVPCRPWLLIENDTLNRSQSLLTLRDSNSY